MSAPKKSVSPAPKKRMSPAAQEAANLEVVRKFFVALVTEKSPAAVLDLLAENFVSHAPGVDGRQGMANFAGWQAENQPKADFVETFHTIAKGDLVIYHYTYSSDPASGPELLIADFFRVTEGKIVAYWDVVKSLREGS